MKAILKQLFSLILPFTVLVVVPYLIEDQWRNPSLFIFIAGLVFISVGLSILGQTISMFIRIGKGTLAPWNPTTKLVISGVYAYVRNPMISGVAITLLGESLFFYSLNIFIWLVAFFIINTVYFILSEEPGLEKRFGADYVEYKRNVPRWIPRLTPWKQAEPVVMK